MKVARRKGNVVVTAAPPLRPDFEFQVRGPAVSAQARNRRLLEDWKVRVTAARAAWQDERPPMACDIEVHISEFGEFATRDRDNMAKPVLDAMQGVVYENDKQIKNLHIEWCDIEGAYVVRHMSPIVAFIYLKKVTQDVRSFRRPSFAWRKKRDSCAHLRCDGSIRSNGGAISGRYSWNRHQRSSRPGITGLSSNM